jgi:hypothetical protein
VATGRQPDLIEPFRLERFYKDELVSELAAAAVSVTRTAVAAAGVSSPTSVAPSAPREGPTAAERRPLPAPRP